MTNQSVFTEIERTGEELKQEFVMLAKKAQIVLESQVNTAKFEAAYVLTVPKRDREKTMKEVKEVRQELWAEALEKADGNTSDACDIYEKLCAFP